MVAQIVRVPGSIPGATITFCKNYSETAPFHHILALNSGARNFVAYLAKFHEGKYGIIEIIPVLTVMLQNEILQANKKHEYESYYSFYFFHLNFAHNMN